MARGKLPKEYIKNSKARNAAFEKRKICLMKKAYELSTLCDVPICVLVYPDHPNSEPLIYPENNDDARFIMDRYLSIPRGENCSKRRLNLQDVVQAKRRKVVDSASNCPNWIPNFDGLSRDELGNLASVLDRKLQFVQERIFGFGNYMDHGQIIGGFDPDFGVMADNATVGCGFDPVQGFMEPQFCSGDQELGSKAGNATVCGGYDLDSGFMGTQFCSFGQELGSSDADLGFF